MKTEKRTTHANEKSANRVKRALTLDDARAKVARNRHRLTLASAAKAFESYTGPELFGAVKKDKF